MIRNGCDSHVRVLSSSPFTPLWMHQMHIKRRDFLKFSAGSLLATGYWPGALRAADADAGEFHFIAVNDFHSLDKKCLPWFEKTMKQMKAHEPKIDFLLVCGDLANDGKKE